MLKRNLFANYLGQGWTALMGLAFIPLYINYLGIEAYGLIGLFAMLTAWLSLLDMGMTPTLSREMALFTGGHHTAESIRDLLRTIEILTLGIALAIFGGTVLMSKWIANSWLQVETMSVEVVAQSFAIMGLVTALRFIETIYRSCIIGLQRQVLFNVVSSGIATIRGLGAVGVLVWISPTIQAFFVWQGVVSIVTLVILGAITYTNLPPVKRISRFSVATLRGVWRFAGGMLGITFLALLLTQVDKILLSKLLTLREYGYYILASSAAGALFVVISPIIQAFYPRLCELHATSDTSALIETYHSAAQLVSVLAGSAAIVTIFFSETLLSLWTQNHDLAARSSYLLSLLMLGNLLNGLMWVPYQTQLAHGWTSLTVQINVIAVILIVPAILWATPRYGAEGAAWVWVVLNVGYLLVGVHFMYRAILTREKFRWYTLDVLAPLCSGIVGALACKVLWPSTEAPFINALMVLMAAFVTVGAALAAAGQVRYRILALLRGYIRLNRNRSF